MLLRVIQTILITLQVRPNEPEGVEKALTLSFHLAHWLRGLLSVQVTVSTFADVVTFLIDQLKSVEAAFESLEYP